MRVVPAGVTISWAVPKKYNGTVGLSTALCFTDVDGGVTMLRLDDSSIDKQSAWPGVAEAEPAPTTRPRSGSVGSR
jgi:hypothetical protein